MTQNTSARRLPSAATILAVIALVLASTGAAVALPGKNKVDRNDIRKNAVVSKAIKAGAVTNAKLAAGAVTSSKLAGGAVTNTTLASAVVTEAKLAGDAITREKIKASAVTKPKLADQAVDSSKLADGAVDSSKLADGAVTDAKVSNLQFQALSLSNGYIAQGTGFATPSFAIDVEGLVHLRGAATQPSGTGGALTTLPAAARPAEPVFAPGYCGTASIPVAARLTVSAGGSITATAVAPADQPACEDLGFVSLDSLSFPAGG